ncbi:MAG: hypothetical protein JJU30_13280 [Alkalimonas sp.]|nr:hypothetical protein [Alkalimonas sp.]
MQTKLISKSFVETLQPEQQECRLQAGIVQWLWYCHKLKPVLLSHHRKTRCVHFQWFRLDPEFKALHPFSLAILFNFTLGQQRPVRGLASCYVVLDKGVTAESCLGADNDLIEDHPIFNATTAPEMTEDSYQATHVLRIIPRSKEQLRAFQACIESGPFSGYRDYTNSFSEPLPDYLARQAVTGIGLDYEPEKINRLLLGYEKAACYQNILVCHVADTVTKPLSYLTDEHICSLKYQSMGH